jgi:hypothetical protein
LARDREALREWVVQANATSVASAARAADISASFHLLPSFLRQLRPLMADLASLSDQATPTLNALSQAAPALAAQYEELVPFADVARRSLIALGAAAQQQQPALHQTIPLDKRLLRLGQAGVPSFRALDRLTASFDKTGGIEDLMGVLFNGTGATNGFDSAGHYIRTEALVGGCTSYAKTVVAGCSANFTHTGPAADVAAEGTAAKVAHAALDTGRGSSSETTRSGTLTALLHYLIGNSQ